jgi:hypothetical protein
VILLIHHLELLSIAFMGNSLSLRLIGIELDFNYAANMIASKFKD